MIDGLGFIGTSEHVQWNTYNSFKPGFTLKLEELMEKKLPRYGIKVVNDRGGSTSEKLKPISNG